MEKVAKRLTKLFGGKVKNGNESRRTPSTD